MSERPILFSAPMVRALLAGTKTQTRRALAPDLFISSGGAVVRMVSVGPATTGIAEAHCPYWREPGDTLWVRETWNTSERCLPRIAEPYIYAADLGPTGKQRWAATWRPSIHMPRAASRITLEVTGVRVERLQDISEADAQAEGCERGADFPGWYRFALPGDSAGLAEAGRAGRVPTAFARLAYRALWESINGPGSWDANPWVWVVEFKRAA